MMNILCCMWSCEYSCLCKKMFGYLWGCLNYQSSYFSQDPDWSHETDYVLLLFSIFLAHCFNIYQRKYDILSWYSRFKPSVSIRFIYIYQQMPWQDQNQLDKSCVWTNPDKSSSSVTKNSAAVATQTVDVDAEKHPSCPSTLILFSPCFSLSLSLTWSHILSY